MIYFEIYLFIATLVSCYIYKQFHDNPELVQYIWNYEIDDDIRELFIKHPSLVASSFIILGLLWPILITQYVQIKNNFNDQNNDYDEN